MRIEKKLRINHPLKNITQDKAVEYLYQLFTENTKEIHDLLFSYHFAKRESVYDIFIDKNLINYNNLKGDFLVSYMIGISNACADISYNAAEKMKIDFFVDEQNNVLLLRGEDIPEQEQYDI